MVCAGPAADGAPLRRHPGTSARGHFTGMATRSLPPTAPVRRAILPGARVGWQNALCAARSPAGTPHRPPSAVRRRDRRRADGRQPGLLGRQRALTGTPTRSLHARGAGAPGDTLRMAEVGGSRCHNALRAARSPAAGPAARRRRPSPRPPARGRGCGGRKGPRPGTSACGHFTGTPARSLHGRGAGRYLRTAAVLHAGAAAGRKRQASHYARLRLTLRLCGWPRPRGKRSGWRLPVPSSGCRNKRPRSARARAAR
jgi:hypothetical protein